ncbi:MAG: glycoside hydrolase family 15 protein, partial [Proteobacteria bacterium]|nr:glycoside hydrolase family 15 protein [Pseudomonadota bacterium]
VTRPELDRMAGFDGVHQGVALKVPPYEYAHPQDLLENVLEKGDTPLLVALDGVTDPRNLGAIIRSTAAFGGQGLIIPQRRSAGVNSAAWKTSAGAAARIPVAMASNLTTTLKEFKKQGVFVLGLDGGGYGSFSLMLDRTREEWRHWVRGLATPVEWQQAVIRSAIALKLCQHEETGAIVAALTTSIPEHAGSGRNWDYRYCWLRDAYYTVQALNRLGALDVLEGYLSYLRNIVDNAKGGKIQPLYGVGGEKLLTENIAPALKGYRGMGPVRFGNQAYEQVQHDAYGQIILSNVQAFFDHRLFRMAGISDFQALESVGERAWLAFDKPDAGLWELRTRNHIHTYSAAMCWAGCDRLANAAAILGLDERAHFWRERADVMHERIEQASWREKTNRLSATFSGDDLDASLLQLLDLHFLSPDDPRYRGTLTAVEQGLRRSSHMLRYNTEDDFGLPATAFNVCTFWLIEALHVTGRADEARILFDEMIARRTPAELLSEDIDPSTGELWGNYPQTYSLVGLINCAALISKPWRMVR